MRACTKASLLAVSNRTTVALGEDLAQLEDDWYSGVEDKDVPSKIVELILPNALIHSVGSSSRARILPPRGTFAADLPL